MSCQSSKIKNLKCEPVCKYKPLYKRKLFFFYFFFFLFITYFKAMFIDSISKTAKRISNYVVVEPVRGSIQKTQVDRRVRIISHVPDREASLQFAFWT